MSCIYVPYQGNKPAFISVNGHRLLILSRDKGLLEENLDCVGADRLRELMIGENSKEEELALSRLADRTDAGVVIASEEIEFDEVLKNLEEELPWVH